MGWVFNAPDNSAGSIVSQKWLGAVSRNSCSNSIAAIEYLATELPFPKKVVFVVKIFGQVAFKNSIRGGGAPIAPFAPHAIAHADRKTTQLIEFQTTESLAWFLKIVMTYD